MTPVKVFIGYDPRESVAFSVLAQSILRRASIPVSITPLALNNLKDIYTRQRGPTESTEFAMTRFLVPYLSDYRGFSIFMDCDMLCQADIAELMAEIGKDPFNAVWVCKHNYIPRESRKFLGQMQTAYPRKNWSSLMVFANAGCKALSPEYVNNASGLELHRFAWTTDDRIGSLPLEWNWLVGEYERNPDAKILHYTLGGPWFEETENCDHADEWRDECRTLWTAPSSVSK